MKKSYLFNIVILVLLFSSCSTPFYYQLVEIDSEIMKEDGDLVIANNNDIMVEFNFWKNGGSTTYSVFNKTNKTIYIKHDECQLIENGLAKDYYDNSEYTSSKSILKGISRGKTRKITKSLQISNIYGSNSIYTPVGSAASILTGGSSVAVSKTTSQTTTTSSSNAVTKTEKKVYVIPPNSFRIINGFLLQDFRFWGCDLNETPTKRQSNIQNGASFNKEDSPLRFSIFITYDFNEDFKNKKTFSAEAYVSRFSNWAPLSFMKKARYKECDKYKYRSETDLYSPFRYYKIYNKYTKKERVLE